MDNRGFTLIEVIVVMGILFTIVGLGLFVSMDFFQGYSQNYEENLVVSVIQRARSQSMTNIDQVKHGVCYDDTRKAYVMFDDDSTCATSDHIFKKADAANINWPVAVIFNQLDGSCSMCPLTVSISSPGRASVSIDINHEGRIDW